jgi:hypothetical protein
MTALEDGQNMVQMESRRGKEAQEELNLNFERRGRRN